MTIFFLSSLELSDYEDRFSLEEMEKSVQQVPAWFVRQLVAIKALKRSDKVIVVEKDKSRTGKVSKHYTFNIIGLSKGDIFQV